MQAVESFFHLCLPRKHEVCSNMVALELYRYQTCGWVGVTCRYAFPFKSNGQGIRAKFHAKAMSKLVFAFSRVAKWLGGNSSMLMQRFAMKQYCMDM